MNKKILLGAAFLIYFFFIIIYNLRLAADTTLRKKTYINKVISKQQLKKIDGCLSKVLLQDVTQQKHNSLLDLYLCATGSNIVLQHFAEPATCYKLVYQITFKDSSIQYFLPRVGSTEIGLRLNNLLSVTVTTPDEFLKDVLVKRLAENELSQHDNVKNIKVVIGKIDLPQLNTTIKKQDFNYSYFYQYNYTVTP